MDYILVKEAAEKWNISERSVRNYCATGRINGAVLLGKNWLIPSDSTKLVRKNKNSFANKSLCILLLFIVLFLLIYSIVSFCLLNHCNKKLGRLNNSILLKPSNNE